MRDELRGAAVRANDSDLGWPWGRERARFRKLGRPSAASVAAEKTTPIPATLAMIKQAFDMGITQQWHSAPAGRIPDGANRPLSRHGDSDAPIAAEVHSFLR
jgi:hypothetical protein